MAQHLPIQAKHHCQFKNNTPKRQRITAFPPGPAHTPPGETVPDRLAVFTHRQAPAPFRATVSSSPPGGAHPCRQATHGVGTSDASPIAWRTRSCRQALHQWSAYYQFSHTSLSTWAYTTNNTKNTRPLIPHPQLNVIFSHYPLSMIFKSLPK